jgi:hypothetical protein
MTVRLAGFNLRSPTLMGWRTVVRPRGWLNSMWVDAVSGTSLGSSTLSILLSTGRSYLASCMVKRSDDDILIAIERGADQKQRCVFGPGVRDLIKLSFLLGKFAAVDSL